MSNKYKGQSLFNEVEDLKLRAWNRCAVFFNIFADQGKVPAQMYAAQFTDEEKAQLIAMFNLVKMQGYETTRKAVTAPQAAVMEA